uniref:Putative ATP-binding protein n=1 Tax=Paenibacillus jamilae TaxID=114136 RepID=Q3MSA7_9BACL|nr:putative ATP-binding protein [Paenibacillus jamilae]
MENDIDKDIARIPEAAEVYLTILGDGKQMKKEYITINNPEVFDVDISQYQKVVIQVDKGNSQIIMILLKLVILNLNDVLIY